MSSVDSLICPPTFVFVDDDPRIRELLCFELGELGLNANVLTDAFELFRLPSLLTSPAIFLDLLLPQMNGIECTSKLRSLGYAGPIILVTSLRESSLYDEIVRVGASDLILKSDFFENIELVMERYSLSF